MNKKEIRQDVNKFLLSILKNSYEVSIKEDQKNMGCVYIYKNKNTKQRNSKKRCDDYTTFLLDKKSETSQLKNINEALIILINHNVFRHLNNTKKQLFDSVLNDFVRNEKHAEDTSKLSIIAIYINN